MSSGAGAEKGKTSKPNAGRRARSAARLAATQALYQMEMTGASWNKVLAEFETSRLGMEIDGETLVEANAAHFRRILEGVIAHQAEIDRATDETLRKNWPLKRIDSILRALFRAAGCELLIMKDVPRNVVLNEYVEVAKAFFEGDEARFANAVLDGMAKGLRPDSGAGAGAA